MSENFPVVQDVIELSSGRYAKASVVMQTGSTGGLWYRDGEAQGDEANGGTMVVDERNQLWRRQCDPARLDARWFGVVADGETDDAPALQAALDALPDTGGKVLLPSGRMRCGQTLRINRSFLTLEGVNCGLYSKFFEAEKVIGQGSLLYFDQDIDGILIQGPEEDPENPIGRLGGITLRDFGVAGRCRQNGHVGIKVEKHPSRTGFGVTDALLLERLYVIDYFWAAELNITDASNLTGCWFSECGNGLRLNRCIYTAVTSAVIADNDGTGVHVEGGFSNDVVSSTFVRNKDGLVAVETARVKVAGGTFETDRAGGPRDDQTFLTLRDVDQTAITGVSFANPDDMINKPVRLDGENRGVQFANCLAKGMELPKNPE